MVTFVRRVLATTAQRHLNCCCVEPASDQKQLSCAALLDWARGTSLVISNYAASRSRLMCPCRAMQCHGKCLAWLRLEVTAQHLSCGISNTWAEPLWYTKPALIEKHTLLFAHIHSKTGCCMGYQSEFIKLNIFHAQMAVSPWVSSFASLLPLCVI